MLALSFLVMIGLSLVIEGWNAEAARTTTPEKLYLFRYGILIRGGNAKYGYAEKNAKNRVVELNEPQLTDKENYSDQAK